MSTLTTRLGLLIPEGEDDADGPLAFGQRATILDAAALYDSGPLASRPAAPHIDGFLYHVTDDDDPNRLDVCYGAIWVTLTIQLGVDLAADIGSLRTLGAGALQACAGNDARLSNQRVPTDGSVTAVKIADALKPSAGASGSTEALRALGLTAGKAMPGDTVFDTGQWEYSGIAAEGTRASSSYGALTNGPDDVTVDAPNGLVDLSFIAMWKESDLNAARAAVFVDGSQLMKWHASAANEVATEAQMSSGVGLGYYNGLSTMDHGLEIFTRNAASDLPVPSTNHVVAAGSSSSRSNLLRFKVTPGERVISVQFKRASGTLTAKERHLWARGL